ncbi:hypothetical protein [Microvirga puerhi]|uniref:PE-PGRS family protein n=1 Tax=Microvirga puerhi TaxID=2876078 RepID=A0ABS7VRE7_9HYPH|nr:hypothetical protein [Microvirga puerhi]MBZ6078104.1 hypothetical protein [Microvirga puerhi]
MPSWYPSFDTSDVIKFDHIDTTGGNAGNGGNVYNYGDQTINNTATVTPSNYVEGAYVHAKVGDYTDATADWDAGGGGPGAGTGTGGAGGAGTGGYGGYGGYGGFGGYGGAGGYGGDGGAASTTSADSGDPSATGGAGGAGGAGGYGGNGGFGGAGGAGGAGGDGTGGLGGVGTGTGTGGAATSSGDQYLETGGNTATITAPTSATQTNTANIGQGSSLVAGIGGSGGDWNHADRGPVVFSLSHPTTTTTDIHDILTHFSVDDALV